MSAFLVASFFLMSAFNDDVGYGCTLRALCVLAFCGAFLCAFLMLLFQCKNVPACCDCILL